MYTDDLVTIENKNNYFTEIYLDIPIWNNYKFFSNEKKVRNLLRQLGKDKFTSGICLHDWPKSIQLHFSLYIEDIEYSIPYALTLGEYLHQQYGIEIDLFGIYKPLSNKTRKAIYKDFKKGLFEGGIFIDGVYDEDFETIIKSWKKEEWLPSLIEGELFRELRNYLWELRNITDAVNRDINNKKK